MASTEKQFKDKSGNDITDANAVHKTGDETIDGQKTFTSSIVNLRQVGSYAQIIKTTNITYDPTAPPAASQRTSGIAFCDSNSNLMGVLYLIFTTTGKLQLTISLKNTDGTTKHVVLAESD